MKVSVYLGSSCTCLEEYNALAFELGRKLATNGHTLVYGGADVGTMKMLADGSQQEGGHIIGVFPEGFKGTVEVQKQGIKVIRDGLDEMVYVKDFAERKKLMREMGDCCVVLPGSYGTLDELFTYACEKIIQVHDKPIFVLNYKGYYNPVKALLKNIEAAGFLKDSARGVIVFCESVDDVIGNISRL